LVRIYKGLVESLACICTFKTIGIALCVLLDAIEKRPLSSTVLCDVLASGRVGYLVLVERCAQWRMTKWRLGVLDNLAHTMPSRI
jgi:hypothetical protein